MEGIATPYKNGFEQIYALEKIDVKTVKRLHAPRTEHVIQPVHSASYVAELPQQLLFPFYGCKRLPSLRLEEPIQLLRLSPKLELALLSKGWQRLGDLRGTRASCLPKNAQEELHSYLGPYPTQLLRAVDFASFLRCLVGDLPSVQARSLLAPFGLERLIPPAAQEWLDSKTAIGSPPPLTTQRARAQALFGRIIGAFVRPWIWEHGYLASRAELEEVLKLYAMQAALVSPALQLLQLLLCGEDPFDQCFTKQEAVGFFAADSWSGELAEQVVSVSSTYFPRFGIVYPVERLISLVERECACRFIAFPERLVSRALRLSTRFRIRRDAQGKKWMTLAPAWLPGNCAISRPQLECAEHDKGF